MTSNTANQVLKILRGSYPNDAWKLSGQNGDEFIGAMMLQLSRYSDGDVLRAVGRVIDGTDSMPSVTMIKKEVKRKLNQVPEYQSLPEAPVNEAGRKRIHEMLSRVQKGFKQDPKEKKPPSITDLPADLLEYIHRQFPNMDDETIMKNADVFKDGRACGMRIGNKRCRFRYDADTKQVDLVVIA